MHQVDLYNDALKQGTDYSDILDLNDYEILAWQFALYHLHSGTGSTLTLTIQYSYDKFNWSDGSAILTTGAAGSGILPVDQDVLNKLYPQRYLRFKIVVGTADADVVFLSLGIA